MAAVDDLTLFNASFVTLSPPTAFSPGGATDDTISDTAYATNLTSPADVSDGQFQQVVDKLIVIGIPAIIIIGFFGNTLSFIVFACTHLRYQSCSVYLAFLNLVDIGFLLSLGIIWFEWLRMNLFHRQVMCQFIIYLSYVTAFLSSWTVVTFTIERYIVVFYPLKKHVLCTPRRAKFIVLAILVTSLGLYSFSIWMNGVVIHGGRRMCIPLRRYYKMLQGFTAADTLITFLLPSLLIIVLNIGIIIKICDFIYRRSETSSLVTEESGMGMDRSQRTGQYQASQSPANGSANGQPKGCGFGQSKECECGACCGQGSKGSGQGSKGSEQGSKCCGCGQCSKGSGQCSKGCGQCSKGCGQCSKGCCGQCSKGCGQCSKGCGQCSKGCGQCSKGCGQCSKGSVSAQGQGCSAGSATTNTAPTKPQGGRKKHHHQVAHGSRCSGSARRQINFIFTSGVATSHGQYLRQNYQIRTTRALVIVSSVYVLLNLPSHAFRTVACILYLTDSSSTFPQTALVWQNVLQLLYYLNFAVNVFLYSASSRSFRSALRRLVTRWRHKLHGAVTKLRSRRLRILPPANKASREVRL